MQVVSTIQSIRGRAVPPTAVAQPKKSVLSAGRKTSSVVPKAAAEEQDTSISVNGSAKETPMVDFDELTDLIRMVNETDIVELSVNSKKFKLAVKKKEALEAAEPQIIHMQAPAMGAGPMAPAAPAPAPAAPAPAAPAPAAPAPKPAAAPAAVDGVEIASPMAGTFYRAPAPGEPAFINEGDTVTQGQTIGIIEAMKLMNEIEAEVSGTVVKITAENGKPVTPGQSLVVIKP
mmetsp:Transcript_923/g.1922  ORF Transcript_923/g.1922 Transcript_923/m.1922 type:complete len:232 (-) Transcript_923:1101-1796(-)